MQVFRWIKKLRPINTNETSRKTPAGSFESQQQAEVNIPRDELDYLNGIADIVHWVFVLLRLVLLIKVRNMLFLDVLDLAGYYANMM